MSDDDRKATRDEFKEAVNMTPKELEHWLATDESQEVGQKDGGGESVGHESGRRIVELLRTKQDALSDDDYAHMRKVVGYVNRHVEQGGPDDDKEHSRWRYSLMNWGHDPLK
jgi:SpoVK/Ycf46/Vps4 family AAA+-type ATPase